MSELVSQSANAGLPLTMREVLQDAIVFAYQRGKDEQRAEMDLIVDSMDKINNRRHDRLTELIVMQCMNALGATQMTVDLSHSLDGTLTTRIDENNRRLIHYTHETGQ